MGIPQFFKVPRHRVFDYRPIYYNPKKEEFERRVENAKREAGIKSEDDEYQSMITRGSMRGYMQRQNRKAKRMSSIRLVVILFVLILIAYYILFEDAWEVLKVFDL